MCAQFASQAAVIAQFARSSNLAFIHEDARCEVKVPCAIFLFELISPRRSVRKACDERMTSRKVTAVIGCKSVQKPTVIRTTKTLEVPMMTCC